MVTQTRARLAKMRLAYATPGPDMYNVLTAAAFGLTSLDELRIMGTETVTDTVNHAPRDTLLTAPTATFVEYGGAIGIVTEKIGTKRLPANVFLEASYSSSPFPSIKWSAEKFLRPNSPKNLNMSHFALSVGFQLGVKEKK